MPPYIPPEHVTSPRESWTLVKVLAPGAAGTHALALGLWEGVPCIGIRYNGTTERPVGHPQSRGLPTWFLLPEDFHETALQGLPAPLQALARTVLDGHSSGSSSTAPRK